MGSLVTLDAESHSYGVEGRRVPLCVSQVLELGGIKQPYPPSAAFFVARARELGEAVHQWAQYLDEGGRSVDAIDGTSLLPYVLAYQRFRDDYCPEWEHIEKSFADEELGVAGTADRIGILKGKRIIADIKTPKKPEKYWGIQLSAYELLSGYEDVELKVIYLSADATYRVISYKSEIPVFLGALEVAKWKLANGIRI